MDYLRAEISRFQAESLNYLCFFGSGDCPKRTLLEDFCRGIVYNMGRNMLDWQRRHFICGNSLKCALPIDRASQSAGGFQFVNQLVKSVGGKCPLSEVMNTNSKIENQARSVFCSVAASGLGKTHSVYTLGCNGDALRLAY